MIALTIVLQGDNTPSICVARYPTQVAAWASPEIESEIKLVQDAVHAARSLRAGKFFLST